jgi:DNA-binding transcriptional regulator YbjK
VESSDARQQRAAERRERVLRATLVLIREHGIDAVTHRAAADAANVPLGSVTYYFENKDQMLREALELWVSEEVAQLDAVTASLAGASFTPAEAAALVADRISSNDPLPQFDLYLYAGRVPALRAAAKEAFAAYDRAAAATLAALGVADPERIAPLFVAMADGLGLREVGSQREPELAEALVTLFEAFTR